jgi:TolB-like protein/regulator of sirC expression with transglutaminase-like and TPR domain
MTVLTIRLLGGFEARLGAGPPAAFPTKKARALLAYLAARPAQAHSRDQIAELLWGARADEQARGSLRRTLSDLRKALPLEDGEWLVSDGDTVKLDDGNVDVDVARFERLAADGGASALEQAIELYGGEFLAGLGLQEGAFEEWLRTERERLRQLALKALTKLLAHHTASEALDPAIQTATRLLALDPANEPAHRTLMQLYARQGRRSEALRQYRLCCEVLMRDLGIQPDAATEALHRELQRPVAVHDEIVKSAEPETAYEAPSLPDKPSIAVLPFANLSGDPEQEYFADGLVEDIIGALSRISGLWVIARASTFSYKGKPIDVKRIARELGVRYVMEGSVRRSGERVRVTAQLADALAGRPVWAERYDRPLADLFDIQDEIARSVAATTETQIMLAEGQAIADAASRGLKTSDFKARDLVTRAWGRAFDQTSDAIEEASQLAEEAIRLDPTYPRAHFMRAVVAFCRLWFGDIPHDRANMARAMELAKTALRLAPRDELAHLTMAWAWAYAAGRLEEAVAECERGLELNPNASLIHGNRGFFLAPLGRSSEAIEASRLALQLNPRDPSNFWRHHAIAVAHFAAHDYAAARNEAKKIALSRPLLQSAIIWAATAAALNDARDARTAVENCLALRPDLTVSSVIPRFMLRFARNADHERLLALLRNAGLPG